MSSLFCANTPARFWQLEPEVTPDRWQAALEAAAGVLPGGASVLAESGWDGLMDHVLGEGQFGPGRFQLGHSKRLYYLLRPILPRSVRAIARRCYREIQQSAFPLGWPIEDRYVRFLNLVLGHVRNSTPAHGPSVSGPSDAASEISYRNFWPDDARFAFVLTHDVERAEGQRFVHKLADLDERYGFRSSFNFVAEEYRVDQRLLAELRERGFEVGVHGLKHDSTLFSSRTEFRRGAARINHYLREWDAVGFRSPATLRIPRWMQELEIEYDSSFFDTDPFEGMPGGTMSIWPFFCGRFVELPYTLAQDHTLLVVLGERTPRLWLDKVDFIARWGGMALVNVHPDYMRDPTRFAVYEEFLRQMADRMKWREGRREGEAALDVPSCWHALPRDVARWWRRRAEAITSSVSNSNFDEKTPSLAERSGKKAKVNINPWTTPTT